VDAQREAWRAKHAREPQPWRGPVHASPLLADLPRGRVVELGAGGGKVGRALPSGAIALDWVAEAVRAGGVLADARRLPFRDASLDALVAIHVLGHVLEREAAVAEWRRALRPGGVLVLEVFARGDAREGVGRLVGEGTWEREGIPTRYFARDELRALLDGFEGEIVEEERAMRWGTRRVLRGRLTRS
jgi:demethylmenaquinone methyltransferase/2-methoxy-6-polyprenyl-1,4-benzoquinol methylase